MGTSTIPLAKGLDLKKMEYPALLSIKKDGVPVKFTFRFNGRTYDWYAETRQGTECLSVPVYATKIAERLAACGCSGDYVFVAEITHETIKDFKDVSGLVRKKTPQTGFILNVFDYFHLSGEELGFQDRIAGASLIMSQVNLPFINMLVHWDCIDMEDAEAHIKVLQEAHPEEEGFILRASNALWKPNSRHWDYQKVVVDPTADCFVIQFEEMVDKYKEPMGMVGAVIVDYKGTPQKVGAGKLSHTERKKLFDMFGTYPISKEDRAIATIKYKRDASYDGLRQGTFQHWRPEKIEPSY